MSGQFKLALTVIFAVLSSGCTPYGILPSPEEIEAHVRSNVPLGATKSEAIGYFSDKGVSHSFWPEENAIYAVVNNVRGTFILVDRSLYIRVYFDESNRVQSYRFFDLYTGM